MKKIPKKVVKEIRSVLYKPNGGYSLRYSSNFTVESWKYLRSMTKEELFNIAPPKLLTGSRRGQYQSKCQRCGKPTRFISYRSGYTQYCSGICGQLSWVERETPKERQKRMGKVRDTMNERYGAPCSILAGLQSPTQMHTDDARANRCATLAHKYGTAQKQTKSQAQARKQKAQKARKSFLDTAAANPNIYTRQTYQRKLVTIKGRTFSVQGYEGVVISYLVHSGRANIQDIEVNPIPIPYREKNKQRLYVPDLRIKISGKWYIVEVKSTYTAGLRKTGQSMFYNLRRKSKAVVASGKRCLTIVYDKGTAFEIENIHELSILQVRELVYQ